MCGPRVARDAAIANSFARRLHCAKRGRSIRGRYAARDIRRIGLIFGFLAAGGGGGREAPPPPTDSSTTKG